MFLKFNFLISQTYHIAFKDYEKNSVSLFTEKVAQTH